MASDYGGPYRPHSTHILHSDQVPQPQCFDGYIGHGLGRVHHQHLQHDQQGLSAHLNSHPHPHPHPQPQFHIHPHPHPHPLSSAQSHDLHGVIQREIEMERIRQEMIMYKILTRRALEAEVRRDLMMVETFLKRGRDGFPFGSPSQMGLDLSMRLPLAETMAEERFLDERSMLLSQRHILNNMCEGGRSESLPFQRASIDVRTGRDSMAKESEVKRVSEGSNKKNKTILEAKPIKNITGAKRASPGSGASAQSDGNLKKQKRVKEEWSCTLCQVTATSERTLNEHLKGKKHKTKEAALKANKSMIGLCTKNAAKPIQSSGTSNQVIEVKLTPKPSSFGKPSSETDGPLPLQGNPNSDNLNKEELVVICTKNTAKPIQSSGTSEQVVEVKLTPKPSSFGKPSSETDWLLPLQCKPNPDNLKKEESVVTLQGKQKGEHKKETYKFWCEMCQVGVLTEKVMKMHQQGKKHKRSLLQNQVVEKTVAKSSQL